MMYHRNMHKTINITKHNAKVVPWMQRRKVDRTQLEATWQVDKAELATRMSRWGCIAASGTFTTCNGYTTHISTSNCIPTNRFVYSNGVHWAYSMSTNIPAHTYTTLKPIINKHDRRRAVIRGYEVFIHADHHGNGQYGVLFHAEKQHGAQDDNKISDLLTALPMYLSSSMYESMTLSRFIHKIIPWAQHEQVQN